MNKKELKKISKKEICGTFSANIEFGKNFNRITGEKATYNNIKEIRDIIDKEIDNGKITTEDEILTRRFELIYEIHGEKDIETHGEKDIETKNKYMIELPYTSSGLMIGYGTGAFGGIAGMGTRLNEGSTKWRYNKCYIKENGLSIEETGDFIRFDKIESINKGEEEGILIKHINITLNLKNDKTFNFRIAPGDLSLIKIIEDNMIPEDNTTLENNTSAMDELLKAKELLEAGLLTTEEFNNLKMKLL